MASEGRLIQAVQLAARKLASSGNFDVLIQDVLAICVEAVEASGGTIYLHDPANKRLRFRHVLPESVSQHLYVRDIADDYGMAGQAFQSRATVLKEFAPKPDSEWTEFERLTNMPVVSMVAAPLMIEDEQPIGVVQLINKLEGPFTKSDSGVLEIVSSVATLAYVNYNLREEQSRASTLLGMGKVGHDIGNLAASLYANLNFSDLAIESLSAQAKPQAPAVAKCLSTLRPMVSDLRESVDRIVGYSHLISDMSAGRPLRPDMRLGHLGPVIETSAEMLENDARSSHVRLLCSIQEDAPQTTFDSLYINRIVQNLVGNAIKAVKEEIPESWLSLHSDVEDDACFGEVRVVYRFELDRHFIEVTDTGPGMSKWTIDRILNGRATSEWEKAGGSGWGTKIVLELTATHGGSVSIDSFLGQGSLFRVTLPHCPGTTHRHR
jgi:signal transduction histidine kinase